MKGAVLNIGVYKPSNKLTSGRAYELLKHTMQALIVQHNKSTRAVINGRKCEFMTLSPNENSSSK